MTVRYAVTFEFDTQPPITHRGTVAGIEKLSPGDQLRLAAACVDEGRYDIGETLARNIADELALVRIARAKGSR